MPDFYNILFNNNMVKISDICVNATGSLLQLINICQCRRKIQHFMLYHPDLNHISIDDYYREILPTFLLAYGVYFTCSLNLVYVEVIHNIQC